MRLSTAVLEGEDQHQGKTDKNNDPGCGGSDKGWGDGEGAWSGLLGQVGSRKTQRHFSGWLSIDKFMVHANCVTQFYKKKVKNCIQVEKEPIKCTCCVHYVAKWWKRGECINKTCFTEASCLFPQKRCKLWQFSLANIASLANFEENFFLFLDCHGHKVGSGL